MSQSDQTSATDASLLDCLDQAVSVAAEFERPDLAASIQTTLNRLNRPDTVVAVVGEFKEGKSSLVNALLGDSLSPVDDDMATAAIAWLHYQDAAAVSVHLRSDGVRYTKTIAFDQIGEYLTEAGNPGNVRGVELVALGVPNPVLKAGLSLLDTPGTDGLDGPIGRVVLDYLRSAHGLIFVTDASAELNAVELRFLSEAVGNCPSVIVALTKIDLYPEWRRILDIDRVHLSRLGDIPVTPVSSVLRVEGLMRADADLNTTSGIPELMGLLRTQVMDNASERSAERARVEATDAIRMLAASFRAQREGLLDTEAAKSSIEELKTTRQNLEQIRKTGSRWSTLLSDGITDLNQAIDEKLRFGFRRLLEEADERLGTQDPAAVWDDYVRDTRQAVADLALGLVERVTCGARGLAEEVTRQLGDEEELLLTVEDSRRDMDVEAGDLKMRESSYNPFSAILTGLRGGSSGIILLGMISRLAGLVLATPVSIGIGVLFAAKQVMDERKRLLDKRRQEARAEARRFLSQAQTDLSAAVRELIREEQRTLRDAVSERLNQLNETYSTTIRSMEAGLQQAEEQRRSQLPVIEARIQRLENLTRAIGVAPA